MNKYFAVVLLLILLQACKKDQGNAQELNNTISDNLANKKTEGMLVYTISVKSEDSNNIQTFYDFNPAQVHLYFKGSLFRMIETGGLSKGNIILDNINYSVYQLDTLNKVAHKGVYSDLASAHSKLQEIMPDHYAPTLEKTDETDIILGFTCKKFKVVKSGFTRADNETFIWITDEIIFPSARYDIETDINTVTTPIPVLIGYTSGTVMRMFYSVDNMHITYEATAFNTDTQSEVLFTLPSDYAIK